MPRAFPVPAGMMLVAVVAAGCASERENLNPSFPITIEQGRAELERMACDPRPLERPVVILGGFLDPGIGALAVGSELRKCVRDPRIVSVNFLFCDSFDACRQRVVDAVDRAFPTGDPNETVEVDVIGLSMGGLVGRYCAANLPTPVPATQGASIERQRIARRLRVHTLYTASSPHAGAL